MFTIIETRKFNETYTINILSNSTVTPTLYKGFITNNFTGEIVLETEVSDYVGKVHRTFLNFLEPNYS